MPDNAIRPTSPALIPTDYRIIRPSHQTMADVEPGSINWPREPTYTEIKELTSPLLDGAWLEHVTVLYRLRACDMLVDEEGLLKLLPRNSIATYIYRANWLGRHRGTDPETLPFICGTAILFPGRRIWY